VIVLLDCSTARLTDSQTYMNSPNYSQYQTGCELQPYLYHVLNDLLQNYTSTKRIKRWPV